MPEGRNPRVKKAFLALSRKSKSPISTLRDEDMRRSFCLCICRGVYSLSWLYTFIHICDSVGYLFLSSFQHGVWRYQIYNELDKSLRFSCIRWQIHLRIADFGGLVGNIKGVAMRNLCLVLSLCLSSLIYAQDVIVLNDGSSIISKVLEVGSTDVKYKKWSNLEGPTYTLKKAEIISINYQNGERESFSNNKSPVNFNMGVANGLTYSEYQKENKNKNIDFLKREELLRSARAWNVAGTIIAIGGVVGGICIGSFGEGQSLVGASLALGIPAVVTGGYCWFEGANKRKEAYQMNVASIPIDKYIINNDIVLESNLICANYDRDKFPSMGFGVKLTF